MLILGIETSCDETAAAVLDGEDKVLSNIISSQVEIHRPYGGVVPEIASRKHMEWIAPVVRSALSEASVTLDDLDGISVTRGPGLIGSLLVGLGTAKAMAYAKKLPLVGIHHLAAHIAAIYLENSGIETPFTALVVSGDTRPFTSFRGKRSFHFWAARGTTLRAKRSTRSQRSWAWDTPAGRRSTGRRETGTPTPCGFREPSTRKDRWISASPA